MKLPINRVIGGAMVAAGAIVGWLGWEERQSLGSQLNELVSGSPSDKAIWMMVAGAVLVVSGVVYAMRGSRH